MLIHTYCDNAFHAPVEMRLQLGKLTVHPPIHMWVVILLHMIIVPSCPNVQK